MIDIIPTLSLIFMCFTVIFIQLQEETKMSENKNLKVLVLKNYLLSEGEDEVSEIFWMISKRIKLI